MHALLYFWLCSSIGLEVDWVMLHGETGEYNGLVSKDQSVSASYSSEKKSGKGTNHKTLAVSEGATQAAGITRKIALMMLCPKEWTGKILKSNLITD